MDHRRMRRLLGVCGVIGSLACALAQTLAASGLPQRGAAPTATRGPSALVIVLSPVAEPAAANYSFLPFVLVSGTATGTPSSGATPEGTQTPTATDAAFTDTPTLTLTPTPSITETPSATDTAPTVTVSVTPSPTLSPEPGSPATGPWSGLTVPQFEGMGFTVGTSPNGTQLTNVFVRIRVTGCSTIIVNFSNGLVLNNHFLINNVGPSLTATIEGTFSDTRNASGTFTINGDFGCGSGQVNGTWTATPDGPAAAGLVPFL